MSHVWRLITKRKRDKKQRLKNKLLVSICFLLTAPTMISMTIGIPKPIDTNKLSLYTPCSWMTSWFVEDAEFSKYTTIKIASINIPIENAVEGVISERFHIPDSQLRDPQRQKNFSFYHFPRLNGKSQKIFSLLGSLNWLKYQSSYNFGIPSYQLTWKNPWTKSGGKLVNRGKVQNLWNSGSGSMGQLMNWFWEKLQLMNWILEKLQLMSGFLK